MKYTKSTDGSHAGKGHSDFKTLYSLMLVSKS